jgi:hypothetical protein
MAVAIQAQLKDGDPELSRLANQRSIRALGIVATPPALNYDPRLLERVDDFAVEHSKVQTAGPLWVNPRRGRIILTGPLNPNLPPLQTHPQAAAVRHIWTFEALRVVAGTVALYGHVAGLALWEFQFRRIL